MRAARTTRRQRGFSLVELMVGMAIGLIGITIITHLYLTNEKYKRSTTGAGTAQVNGAIALYTLERDIRASGYGINHSAALGCTCTLPNCSPVRYHYNGIYSYPPSGGAVSSRPPLTAAPVVITSVNGTPDTITVLSSTDNEGAVPNSLFENMANALANLRTDGTAGYVPPAAGTEFVAPNGNFLLVAQAGTCMLTRVTNVVPGSTLERQGTSLWNPGAGSSLPTFSAGAYVFNLGITPAWRTYSVSTTAGSTAYKLQVIDVLKQIDGSGSQLQIVDDIVDIQAEYGRDANNNGTVEASEWSPTVPANATEWLQVMAIRVGVLARSNNYEQPDPPGSACTATTSTPRWSGSLEADGVTAKPASAFTVPGGVPSCYKHRVFETVIPLRNMIWRQS